MKKILIKIKPCFKYFIVFFFFLFWNLIIQPVNLDEVWNYGFAHNIYKGLVPYLDFNMVITPFFPFIMSIIFKVFGSSMLIFHIEWAAILTFIVCILDKYLKDKSYLLLFFMIFPLSVCFPSYNMFLFFLFLIIITLEDKKANDFIIGMVLGCIILTKQTVGVLMFLPSLYYFKDLKKILKRISGCFVVLLIFLLYLLFTHSFLAFFDLCFLGLFDFASSNGNLFNIYFVLGIIMILVVLYLIKGNTKNIKNYYFLAFFSVLIPLFDLYHFEIVFLAFLFTVFTQKDIKTYLNIKLFIPAVLIGLVIINLWYRDDNKIIYPNTIKHFEYRYLTNKYIDYSNNINNLYHKYRSLGKEVIFLSADGYYFKIINDIDIGYLDLINTGNFGYNGSLKLMDMVKSRRNCVFFVDKSELGSNKQTDQAVLKYVINKGILIEEMGSYSIYEMEDR